MSNTIVEIYMQLTYKTYYIKVKKHLVIVWLSTRNRNVNVWLGIRSRTSHGEFHLPGRGQVTPFLYFVEVASPKELHFVSFCQSNNHVPFHYLGISISYAFSCPLDKHYRKQHLIHHHKFTRRQLNKPPETSLLKTKNSVHK